MSLLQLIHFGMGETSELVNSNGTFSVQSTIRRTRSGDYALRTNPVTTAMGFTEYQGIAATGIGADFNLATVYCTFYFNIQTLPASLNEECFTIRNTNSANKCSMRMTSAGKLTFYNSATSLIATSTTTFTTGTWYRIEVMAATGTTAAYEVRINGVTEMSGTTDLTTFNTFRVRLGKTVNRNGQSVDFVYQDLAIRDDAFQGSFAVKRMAPTANGATHQWTAGTGASGYVEVSENPPDDDTSYIQKNTATTQTSVFSFQTPQSAGVSDDPIAIKVFVKLRKNGGVVASSSLRIVEGGTTTDTSATDQLTTYRATNRIFETNPRTAAQWTLAQLATIQAGIIDVSATTNQVRITAVQIFAMFLGTSKTATVPKGTITLSAKAPTAALTNNKRSIVPLQTITLVAKAPTAQATNNKRALVPAASITLTRLAPTAIATSGVRVFVPAASIALNARAPSSVATANVTARIPRATITLSANAFVVHAQDNKRANVPAQSIALSANALNALVTQNRFAIVPRAEIMLQARAPQAQLTGHNYAQIPLKQVVLTARAPSSALTENRTVRVPVLVVALNAHTFVVIPNGVPPRPKFYIGKEDRVFYDAGKLEMFYPFPEDE